MNFRRDDGFSTREIVIAVAVLGLLVTVMLPMVGRAREAARRSNCAYNLKEIAYTMRMYALESPGHKLPPVQIHVEYPALSNPYYQGNLTEFEYRFRYDFAPSQRATYFGYGYDPKMLICPSDLDNELRNAEVMSCEGFNDSWDRDSRGFIKEGCIDHRDDSYKYYGWVFDKGGDAERGDPLTQGSTLLEASWRNNFVVPQFKSEGDEEFEVPVQLNAALTAMHHQAWGETKSDFFSTFHNQEENSRTWIASDSDLDIGSARFVEPDAWDPDVFYGNGRTNTVYRLRDGVARFLYTDVNNPEVARLTSATIWTMHEKIALTPEDFFHTPAGSNVLYMDGHVEFVLFGERAPVMKSNAYFLDQFANL